MVVPDGFPGEHRKMILIEGSASIASLTWMGVTETSTRVSKRPNLVHSHREPSGLSTLAVGGFQLKRDLDDSDIVYLGANGIHPIGRGGGQDLFLPSGFDDYPDQQVDDLIRTYAEEDVFGAREVSDVGDPGFDQLVGRRRIAVQIKPFDLVQLGLLCRLVGVDGVAKRVFVGVEKDTLGVVVPRASIGVQCEDIGPDYRLEVEVSRFSRVLGFGETVDWHFEWLYADFEKTG